MARYHNNWSVRFLTNATGFCILSIVLGVWAKIYYDVPVWIPMISFMMVNVLDAFLKPNEPPRHDDW